MTKRLIEAQFPKEFKNIWKVNTHDTIYINTGFKGKKLKDIVIQTYSVHTIELGKEEPVIK